MKKNKDKLKIFKRKKIHSANSNQTKSSGYNDIKVDFITGNINRDDEGQFVIKRKLTLKIFNL